MTRELFVTDAEFLGVLVDSAEKNHTLHFVQTAPGRYEASVEAHGSLFGKVFQSKNGQLLESSIVQFPGIPGREHELGPQGKDRLQQLTGNLVESPEKLQFSNQASQDIQPLQKQILLLAALLFLLDVAARRIDFRSLKLRRKKERILQPAPASVVLGTLKERKKGVPRKDSLQLDSILAAAEQKQMRTSDLPVADFKEEKVPAKTEPSSEHSSDYMQRLKEAKRRKS